MCCTGPSPHVSDAERYEQVTFNRVASTKVGANLADPTAGLVTAAMPHLEATEASTLAKLATALQRVYGGTSISTEVKSPCSI